MKTKNYVLVIFILSLCDFTYSYTFNFKSWFNNYYCDYFECCSNENVPYDLGSLEVMLYTKLYGQHIAKEIVLTAINSHLSLSEPKKPLVMSFHGANGVGKTYVTRMIAKALYKKGERSNFYHFYYGLENFPLADKLQEYQKQLKRDIEIAISNCEKSLFVFDGVDHMPPGLLNILMPIIDCKDCTGNIEKNKAIFIFLTNTGSLAIEKYLLEQMNEGKSRESTAIVDFEKLMVSETYSISGGLFKSLMITKAAIDFYVPFLPLERSHVKNCIEEAFEDLHTKPTEELINSVFKELSFGPEPDNLFSKNGCKRVALIAGRILSKLNSNFDDFYKKSHKKEL